MEKAIFKKRFKQKSAIRLKNPFKLPPMIKSLEYSVSYAKVLAAFTSDALQVVPLLGAVVLLNFTLKNVSSSNQVWHQLVQVVDHYLCPGMPLNQVYDVYLDDVGPLQHVCSVVYFPLFQVEL
jgi:hypothetical protein